MKSTIKFLVLTMLLMLALASIAGCTPLEHTWAEATCTAPKTCTDCGITEGEALGHTEQIIPAKEATCYEKGLTEGKICSVCNEVLVEQKVVLSLGHDIVIDQPTTATCTQPGLTAGAHCSRCDYKEEQTETPALGHSYMFPCDAHCQVCGELGNKNAAHTIVAVAAKAATCTENGNVAYWYCSDCGAAWADEALTQLTNQKNVVIPAPGHSYMFPCDAHCMVCGELTNENAAHTIVAVEAKAATCTENGNVAYWTCSDCGGAWLDEALTLVANRMSVIVPATGHSYEGFSCETDGVCSCGAIKPAAHTLNYVAAVVPANCLENGHDEYWECTACGAYFGNAEASQQLNPAWMFYTGDCVRPENAADCANVPCTLCGNETYGQGDHDVFACKGGLCTKCNTEIEGYGCANYDTPACEDGFCSYCGDPVKGFGHENGAWAPCCDGECSYGCGLFYPATEPHVDEDNDDYCDGCWNHLNHDVDPCLGGECSICWASVEPAHKIVAVDALAPTCYENGNIAYWYCEACGQAWLDADCILNTNLKAVVLPMAHGTITAVEAVAPTCYENGNIAYWYCEACGQAWLDADCTLNTNLKAVVLPMAHGAITHVEAVAPTCTAMGNIEYWYCEACGQAWLDEACTLNTNLKAVKLPAAHTYTYPCDQICSVCYELTNPDATHTIVAVEAKAATCTANGNVAYWYCSDCGSAWLDADCTIVTNLKSVTLPVTDHNYIPDVIDPTCTKDGYTDYACECGDSYTDNTVPALGHKDENNDYKCDACSTKMLPADGEALTIPQALAIAKLMGDTYTTQKYYITGAMTNLANTQYGNFHLKDADGNEIYIYGLYSADGNTRYDAMSYKPVNGDELTVYTVLGCYYGTPQGKSAWMDEVVIHEEHDYVSKVTAPTCYLDGYTTHTCWMCGDEFKDSEVAALGHTTEAGECERCGQTIGGDVVNNETFTADFNTVTNTNTSYVNSTTTSGWVATNCAVMCGGTSDSNPKFKVFGDAATRAFTMNGKTTAKGSIVSPTISGGISYLSFNFTNCFSESKGVDITITIKQNGVAVATKKLDQNSVTKLNAYTCEWDLAAEGVAVKGDFTIEFTNNSPSNSTSNKDRVSIWNVQWTTNY